MESNIPGAQVNRKADGSPEQRSFQSLAHLLEYPAKMPGQIFGFPRLPNISPDTYFALVGRLEGRPLSAQDKQSVESALKVSKRSVRRRTLIRLSVLALLALLVILPVEMLVKVLLPFLPPTPPGLPKATFNAVSGVLLYVLLFEIIFVLALSVFHLFTRKNLLAAAYLTHAVQRIDAVIAKDDLVRSVHQAYGQIAYAAGQSSGCLLRYLLPDGFYYPQAVRDKGSYIAYAPLARLGEMAWPTKREELVQLREYFLGLVALITIDRYDLIERYWRFAAAAPIPDDEIKTIDIKKYSLPIFRLFSRKLGAVIGITAAVLTIFQFVKELDLLQ